MKRSLLLTNDFPPIVSGISTYFYKLWEYLPQNELFVLAPKCKDDELIDSKVRYKIFRKTIPVGESCFAKILKMSIICFWAIIFFVKYQIKFLHCGQVLSTGLAGLICHLLFNCQYVVYVCGSESVRFGRIKILGWLIKKILNHADKIIANSQYTYQEYIRLGISPDRLTVVTPGVDIVFFKPQKKQNYFQTEFQLNNNFVMLTVSRLDERKGHDQVLKALASLKNEFPDIKYLIAGTGREKIKLQNDVKRLDLEKNVIFTGFIKDEFLPQLYNCCNIFILPNRETTENLQLKGDVEGFGIVFLEAAACGKPAIAGNNGGAVEAVAHNETGYLINPIDSKEIENTIKRFLEDKDLSARMGKKGRQRCIDHFQWKQLSKSIEFL